MMQEDEIEADSFSTEASVNMKSRSQRRDELLRLIVKNGKNISKDHLLGIFLFRAQVKLSTAYEYLQELKMARFVVESSGQLLSMDQHLAEQEKDSARLQEIVDGQD